MRSWGDERPGNAEMHDRVYLHGLAYVERPSGMERRLHRDETKARALLRPRTGNVSVLPMVCPVEEAA